MIRYDLKAHKFIKTITIIVWLLLFCTTAFVALADGPISTLTDSMLIMVAVATFLFTISIPLAPIFTCLLIDSSIYLRRLKKNGYTLPKSKKDYEGKLANLPREGEVTNRYAGDSKKASIIALICYGLAVAGDIAYLVKWINVESDSIAMFIMLLIFESALFISSSIYYRLQGNKEKYVDDVDVTFGRKARRNIVCAVITLIIMLFATSIALTLASSMTRYVHITRVEARETTETAVTDNTNC